jgi:anti-sigma factor (TIGR02949 family)
VTCEDVARALDAYVDEECDRDTATAVRRHVAECVACQERLAEYDTIGRLVRSVPYYPAPDRLRSRVSNAIAESRPKWHVPTWAAAAVLAIGIGGGLFSLRSMQQRMGGLSSDTIADEVVTDHIRSLMADHLFDVRSTDQHTVKPWFLGKLDFSPPVTDLAALGFPLVGGRLEYVAGHAAAALVYQRQKHTINVLVWPSADGASQTAVRSLRGFHVEHWVREGMAFWVVSDLNIAELTTFAHALQQ